MYQVKPDENQIGKFNIYNMYTKNELIVHGRGLSPSVQVLIPSSCPVQNQESFAIILEGLKVDGNKKREGSGRT
jgi:hypothetical protein